MKFLLIFVSFVTSMRCATALDAHFENSGIVINDFNRSIHIPGILGNDAFYGTVHAIQKRGTDYYLVIGTSWPSRGLSATRGMCAAGIESSIEWLQIRKAQVIKKQEGRYESCMNNREAGPINWKGHQLIWTAEAFEYKYDSRDSPIIERDYTWTFDTQNPEAGILEEKKEAQQGAAANP